MAGYLLRSEPGDAVSLCYCELCAYSRGQALLKVYTDEWCEQEVVSISMTASTAVSTRTGSYCTVFGVDAYRFCARTMDEKELWLRAVSNVKVKLMFDAPDPTDRDLSVFREAVWTRVEQLPAADECPPSTQDPLLTCCGAARRPAPRGTAATCSRRSPRGPARTRIRARRRPARPPACAARRQEEAPRRPRSARRRRVARRAPRFRRRGRQSLRARRCRTARSRRAASRAQRPRRRGRPRLRARRSRTARPRRATRRAPRPRRRGRQSLRLGRPSTPAGSRGTPSTGCWRG
ncbi:unnamed protein product [Prorocentrum cordatum]|uniref:PH domain-containing protein n=1 Tax=Prorocentrum cordatum TaxID=2364126 RepID=A0ABN9Q995_9DINO|nr:unnamed protein product [Polarella glacialis]